MKAGDAKLEIQRILGIPEKDRFPNIGPRTLDALAKLDEAPNDQEWPPVVRRSVIPSVTSVPWQAFIEGEDIIIPNAKTTWFGGDFDSMDSGETASGYPTKGHPDLIAASLPMNYAGSSPALRKALYGSPIPRMPFGLKSDGSVNHDGVWVHVTYLKTGQTISAPVIDIGPALWTGNALDLSVAAFRKFAPISLGKILCDVRIIGAAKYVTSR